MTFDINSAILDLELGEEGPLGFMAMEHLQKTTPKPVVQFILQAQEDKEIASEMYSRDEYDEVECRMASAERSCQNVSERLDDIIEMVKTLARMDALEDLEEEMDQLVSALRDAKGEAEEGY